MAFLFEGCNIRPIRRPDGWVAGGDDTCQNHESGLGPLCGGIATYTLHGPDDSIDLCGRHLAVWLLGLSQSLLIGQ